MLCPSCGKEVAETDARCASCGSSLSPDKIPSAEAVPGASASAPLETPQPPLRSSSRARASLILGLFPFVLVTAIAWFGVFFVPAPFVLFLAVLGLWPVAGVFAVIFGHGARALVRKSGGQLPGGKVAMAGLVLGYLGLVGWLGFVIPSILLPTGLVHSPIPANQALAVGSLRTINAAAITYAATYDHGFPATLAALGPPKTESPNASYTPMESAAGLIDELLAASTKSGYRFAYIPGKAGPNGKIETYTVRAEPINPGVTGKMYYFTDQSGVIREEEGKAANEQSKPLPY